MINPEERMVRLYNKPIELTPKEFDILYLLASHPKKVFSTENIFEQCMGRSLLRRQQYSYGAYTRVAEEAWRR